MACATLYSFHCQLMSFATGLLLFKLTISKGAFTHFFLGFALLWTCVTRYFYNPGECWPVHNAQRISHSCFTLNCGDARSGQSHRWSKAVGQFAMQASWMFTSNGQCPSLLSTITLRKSPEVSAAPECSNVIGWIFIDCLNNMTLFLSRDYRLIVANFPREAIKTIFPRRKHLVVVKVHRLSFIRPRIPETGISIWQLNNLTF